MPRHPTKPCAGCPFARVTEVDIPGTVGGSPPEIYVGQAFGPFFLPCHSAEGYRDNATVHGAPECAGAAIFRSNAGWATPGRLPAALHHLPADHEVCFSSPEELIAHHWGITLDQAKDILVMSPPDKLFRREFDRAMKEKGDKAITMVPRRT